MAVTKNEGEAIDRKVCVAKPLYGVPQEACRNQELFARGI